MLRFFISICISFTLMTTAVTAEEMTQQEREEIAAKLIPIITMLLFSDDTNTDIVKNVISGDNVILNSNDLVDYNATSTYTWALSSSNPDGTSVVLNDSNTSEANFLSPIVSTTTTLVFTLTVTDSSGNIETYPLTIKIKPDTRNLIINEISSAYFTDEDRWFEIYNASNLTKNLSNYILRSPYYDGTDHSITTFTLPSKVIPPKGYLIIRPDYGPAYNKTLPLVDNNQVISLKDSSSKKYPIWYTDTNGFLEILQDGKTIDFVTIGANYTPTTVSEWSGDYIPSYTTDGTKFYQTLARDIKSSDTNTKSDWVVRDYATYAGLNDVTCNDDVDVDGIPDCSEVNGSTYAGIDIYAFGARTNQKDIFIEVDYMDSTNEGALTVDEGVIPHQEALQKVKNSFLNNGYVVHFDVGDLYAKDGTAINPSQMDLGGGNEVSYAQSISFSSNTAENLHNYKVANMEVRRKTIFYYMLFGTSQNIDGSTGSSGIAEKPGNDSIMTLGAWGLNTTTIENTNKLINFQAGTVMHEFGHNLNLGHGGNEDKNFKPNYLSVMNYLYQLDGLSTIGDNEGDRYYSNKSDNNCPDDTLTNPYYGDPQNFKLDYSHGTSTNLDEVNGIVEANGLGRAGSVPVDYNCNNDADETLTNYNVNPNNIDNDIKDILSDHDDWSTLNIIFARTYDGNSGISINSSNNNKIFINPLMNDIQPIAEEPPIKIPTHSSL